MTRQKSVKFPNLLAEMARKGETQRILAELLQVSNPTISRKLNGQINWTIDEVDILCEHFGKDFYELFAKNE